jgi:hypothetical protein
LKDELAAELADEENQIGDKMNDRLAAIKANRKR